MVNGLLLPCAECQHVYVSCRLGYITNWLSQATLSGRLQLKIKEESIQPLVTMNHPATRDHESYAWRVICHVRHHEVMTQHYANLNSESIANSNRTQFVLSCHSALFSNTLSLRSYLNVSDKLSHPHKTTGKFIRVILYFLFFYFCK